MWPWYSYVQRRRRPTGRLTVRTPPPSGPPLGLPGPASCAAPAPGSKGKLQMKILPKLKENVEATQLRESPTTKHCMQLNGSHQKNLQESHITEDSRNMNTLELKESMTELQGEINPINTQTIASIASSSEISLSLLSSSDTDFCSEITSFEDSFPSPEIFRGGEFLDFNDYTTESCLRFRNSTLLDSSRAMTIENMQQFSNLSSILDNTICKILPETEETPEIKSKPTNFSAPIGKKNRGLLTSSPSSSEIGRFEVDLSPVKKLTLEGELNPNTSNYVYSDEIVPATSSEEGKDSWEDQCFASKMCCIIQTSPRNGCTKIPCCPFKGVSKDMINEPPQKEKWKTKKRMKTIKETDTRWREEVPCTTSEMCCIVKASPRTGCMKMPCYPPKRMSKDIMTEYSDD